MLYFVVVADLPEEDEQLLMEADALARAGQEGLRDRVVEQATEALEQEGEVLFGTKRKR